MADLVAAMGIASARIYAAFGSKEALFREAVALYETTNGSFAERALNEEPTARQAIGRMLREAVELYTRADGPKGCMVVSAATNCAVENDALAEWLAERRRRRTASIVERLEWASATGELSPGADVAALGDHYAALLHGLSVQARDGIPRDRLLALIPLALHMIAPETGRSTQP